MKKIHVLLAGESWVSNSTHFKGFDFFSSTVYETGTAFLKPAFQAAGIEFTHMPSHQAAEEFPFTLEELMPYDVVILSDIGANTLLLPPDTWLRGKSMPNRLKLLAQWVELGGGLAMCGGYLSFAGMYASAKYYRSPLEAVLPVMLHTFDDRVECPEGAGVEVLQPAHPILQGVALEQALLLGFNELMPRTEADMLALVDDRPLLAVRTVGNGRTLAWASDIGPHWCPESFASSESYARLWAQTVRWLAKEI